MTHNFHLMDGMIPFFFKCMSIIFLIFIYLFILFLAVLGLRFCARAFSSCGKRGPLFIAVRRPLTIAASLVVGHRLQTRRFSNCGSRAQLLCGMWDPPRPGLEPVSPALAGRFSTTAPPGKPRHDTIFICHIYNGIFLYSVFKRCFSNTASCISVKNSDFNIYMCIYVITYNLYIIINFFHVISCKKYEYKLLN